MNLPVSLAVLALSVALLFFGRGREVGMTVMVMFAAGLMGVAANLNWLH